MTAEEAAERLRENAMRDRGGLDPIDQFLISMVRLVGVETTDRYVTGGVRD